MMKLFVEISLFLDFPWKFQANICILSFQKMKKKDCSILTTILVQGICPLKVEIAQFPIGFHLTVRTPEPRTLEICSNIFLVTTERGLVLLT